MTQLPTLQVPGMSARLSLRKNFTWTFAGNMVYAASQWGVLVLLAKLGSPAIVGQFALGLAITAPVIMFCNLALRAVQATDARHEYAFGDYFGLRLMTTLAADCIIIVIVFLSGYPQDTALVILFIGLSKSFEAVSDICFGLLQRYERMDRIAKSLMIEGPITLAVMALILYLTHSIVWAAGGMALVWGLQLALYDMPSGILILRAHHPDSWRQHLRPRFHLPTLRRLVFLALPLGIVMLLLSLNSSIPRIFVEHFLGEAQLGVFTAMAYLIVAGNTVMAALGQSASPRLATYYARGDGHAYSQLLIRVIAIGASLGLAGVILAIMAGEWGLNLLYGPEYAASSGVFVWVMVAGAISYVDSIMGYAVTSARVFKLQVLLSGFPAIIVICLSILLIPGGNLQSAAMVIFFVSLANCLLKTITILWIVTK